MLLDTRTPSGRINGLVTGSMLVPARAKISMKEVDGPGAKKLSSEEPEAIGNGNRFFSAKLDPKNPPSANITKFEIRDGQAYITARTTGMAYYKVAGAQAVDKRFRTTGDALPGSAGTEDKEFTPIPLPEGKDAFFFRVKAETDFQIEGLEL